MSNLIVQCGKCGTYTSSAMHTCTKFEVHYNNKIYPIYAKTAENAAERLSEKLNKLVEVEIDGDFYATEPRSYVGQKKPRKLEQVVPDHDAKKTQKNKGKSTGNVHSKAIGAKSED